MMDIRKFSATGRPVDPQYATNRAIGIITASIFIIAVIYQWIMGKGFLSGIGHGLGIAATVFIAWAMSREIDPDHNLSAFVSSAIALIGVIFFYPPDFVGLIWLLLILRIINHSSGLSANMVDSVIITLLALWLTYRGNWIYGSFTVIALILDAWLEPKVKKHIYFAALNAFFVLLVWLIRGFLPVYQGQNWLLWGSVLLLSLLFIPVLKTSARIKSTGDDTDVPLNPYRVQASQIFAVLFGLMMILYRDMAGLREMSALFASLAGISLYHYYIRLRRLSGANE